MRKRRVSAISRTAALIVAVLLLAALVFSSLYIIKESRHECTGHSCAVCANIRVCEEIIHRSCAAALLLIAAIAYFRLVYLLLPSVFSALVQGTPVSRKVRINI